MESGIRKFEKLSEARRLATMNAAIEVFGRYGYAKASTELIARKARISKSLLFFYFGNKRGLYLYVMDFLAATVTSGVVDNHINEIDDMFEVIEYASRRKVAILAKMPSLMSFSLKAFYPEKSEIKAEMDEYMNDSIEGLPKMYFSNVRWDKFRSDVDPKKILRMLVWMTDGYLHERLRLGQEIDIESMMAEFVQWCDLLKRTSYKEEYL